MNRTKNSQIYDIYQHFCEEEDRAVYLILRKWFLVFTVVLIEAQRKVHIGNSFYNEENGRFPDTSVRTLES